MSSNPSASPTAAGERSRDGAMTVSLVVLCQLVHGLTFSGIPMFLPLIRDDLQITFSQAGLLSAAATLSYAFGQVPAGYLSDRFGLKRLFFIGLLGWSVLSITLGLVHTLWLAVLNQLLAGAFRALLFAPGMSLLVSWFRPKRRATAMSLYMVGGFWGTVVLSLFGPWLAHELGWRLTFMLLAAVGVAAAFIYRYFAKEKPRRGAVKQSGLAEVVSLFKHKILWVCSAIQFIRFSVVTAVNIWLPSLLVVDRGFSLQQAGFVTAMSAAFIAPSNAIGAYVSDRLKNPPLVIGASLAILACGATLLVTVTSVAAMLLVVVLMSVFLQFYFGPLFLVPMEVLGQRTTGMTTGIANLFANIGGFLTAYALGVVKDHAGSFKWGFIGVSLLCLIGVVLSLVLHRMRTQALRVRHATA
ncbi:MAG: MFS transporter [Rhodospirillaceae bacterium]